MSEDDALRWLLEFARRDKIRLLEKLHRATSASARLMVQFAAVDRLHSSLEYADVLDAIEDIVLNVIGGERLEVVPLDHARGVVAESIASGRVFLRSDDPHAGGDQDLTACIPLRIGCRPVGAITIYSVAKKEFTPSDIELFSVLAKHAAMAVYSSTR